MFPPELYELIIDGLEEQARELAEQPQQTDVHVAMRQDLRRLADQFRHMAAEPVPDELKPEYGENVVKEAEANLAALEQTERDLDKPPAPEPFVPWDGEKLWLDLVLAMGYEPVARPPTKMPEKPPTCEAPVAPAKAGEKPPARKPPVAPIKVKPPPRDDPFGTVKG